MEPTDHVVAAFLLAGIGLHALFVGSGFVLHWYEAQNRGGGPAPLSYLRAFLLEWWFTFGVLLLWPIGWLLPRLPRRFEPGGGPPLLLVHGYLMNRSCMFALYWRLARAGYRNVYTVTLPTWRGVASSGTALGHEIRELARLAGGEQVVLVAHSMGGVIARWCVAEEPTLPVERIVSVCTPHRGTRVAVLGLDAGSFDLRVGSRLLRALPETPHVPLFAIYAAIDNVVIPTDSAALGESAIELPESGHVTPLCEARGFRALLELLPHPTLRALG